MAQIVIKSMRREGITNWGPQHVTRIYPILDRDIVPMIEGNSLNDFLYALD